MRVQSHSKAFPELPAVQELQANIAWAFGAVAKRDDQWPGDRAVLP